VPTLDPSLCKPGDILLFYGVNLVSVGLSAARFVKGVTVLPAVVSAAQGGSTAFTGSATANHAAIVCGSPSALEFADASSVGGVSRMPLASLARFYTGDLHVFRMTATPLIAAAAAVVARKWATTDKDNVGMKFGTAKAGLCAFRSSTFGPDARQRAVFYRQQKDTAGGPQDWKNLDRKSHKAMFCSMFVIACYQAVMDDATTETMLALDAKTTSPMYLDGYLRNSALWHTVNAMAVS
jgi:hypothetical protein